MIPAVEFFQQEHPKEGINLVGRRARVAVVDTELDRGEWILANELLNQVVFLVFEPPARNGSVLISV